MYSINNFDLDFKIQNVYVLFDGNNIAITKRNKKLIALSKRLKNLQKLSKSLTNKYINVVPLIIIDHGLQRIIDDKLWLNQQLINWNVFQCEEGYKADDYLIGFLKIMPFQVLIVSNDRFRQYKIPQILAGWDWRLEPITKGTSVYVPRLKSYVNILLSILNLKEQVSISKSLAEEMYTL